MAAEGKGEKDAGKLYLLNDSTNEGAFWVVSDKKGFTLN